MPAGTVTSFPSIVRVTSARLGMVVEKSRAPVAAVSMSGQNACLSVTDSKGRRLVWRYVWRRAWGAWLWSLEAGQEGRKKW